ncbi:MAG: NAD(P)H-dependent oxidoreductase subunit E [Candidatus Marinimicrobia bacterium]|nr:NAD(P)H-dependent oxidoreductase subunit E [Candidatus Neomarinimicrobiota bacterium]
MVEIQTEIKVSDDLTTQVADLIDKYGHAPKSAIPLLLALQERYNYLPKAALRQITDTSDISAADITGIASFYSQFRLQPGGKHFINVCTGTACHVKGAGRVWDTLKTNLKLAEHQDTDRDRIFTVRKVACLGCCTLAPVLQIDQITYGHVAPRQIPDILNDYLDRQKQSRAQLDQVIIDHRVLDGEIRIGLGSCCVAGGSHQVKDAIEWSVYENALPITVKTVGCVGMCHRTPMVEIHKKGQEPRLYSKVTVDMVHSILAENFKSPQPGIRWRNALNSLLERPFSSNGKNLDRYELNVRDGAVADFLSNQRHIATEYYGELDPVDLVEYEHKGGFSALRMCLGGLNPTEIIAIVKESGLQGRGGAGFPTGRKWELIAESTADRKFIICNGDEGDPGAFMDRMLLESYPYRIIEGLLIAAVAIGATTGYFYIRAEYPLAVARIQEALDRCYELGYLGQKIFNSELSFNLSIHKGAGAFVCGEETALIKSIEGKRGNPRVRPPFPVQSGLWDAPTLINNVESLALLPWILRNGPEQFATLGTTNSRGTKVFSLAGKIANGGLIEVPMGISINKIVYEIGGGIADGGRFKAVQIGGPSGGCIPAELGDTPVDYAALLEVGAMMGSGGLLVMDENDCMVDIARYFLGFTQDQSCGRCTYCRIGTKRMLEILEDICAGKGTATDLVELEKLAGEVKRGSICGLGKTAPNPVLTTLRYFRSEYQAHIEGYCPAKKCTGLISYSINDNCVGCTLCAQNCPVNAISLTPYTQHIIDQDLCIKCDTCRQVCPDDAVEVA